MTPAPVTVAVVSTNLRELLAATLRSLEPEARAGRADVWVVDNASSDGSPEMVRSDFPWVSLIAAEENLGYGAAVNQVAARTASEWIAPANEDIELEPGALERLLECGRRHRDAAVVAPRLVQPDGQTQHSVFCFPTVVTTVAIASGLAALSRRLGDHLCVPGRWDATREREVPWAIATFVVVRRDAFDAVGGFDEQQWMHAEDLDLSWRLREAGWSTRYEPAASVRHVGSAATTQAFGEGLTARWWAAGYRFLVRRRGVGVAWTVAALNLAGTLARIAFWSVPALVAGGRARARVRRLRAWAAIHLQGLRSRRSLLSFR